MESKSLGYSITGLALSIPKVIPLGFKPKTFRIPLGFKPKTFRTGI